MREWRTRNEQGTLDAQNSILPAHLHWPLELKQFSYEHGTRRPQEEGFGSANCSWNTSRQRGMFSRRIDAGSLLPHLQSSPVVDFSLTARPTLTSEKKKPSASSELMTLFVSGQTPSGLGVTSGGSARIEGLGCDVWFSSREPYEYTQSIAMRCHALCL